MNGTYGFMEEIECQSRTKPSMHKIPKSLRMPSIGTNEAALGKMAAFAVNLRISLLQTVLSGGSSLALSTPSFLRPLLHCSRFGKETPLPRHLFTFMPASEPRF
ncbi:hypothetical protein CV944_14735 [Geobacillus sp. WSUCF-018B]|nr:hypothetical protein CV944_14735 [Geobacillus sp. WSUCF-018B]